MMGLRGKSGRSRGAALLEVVLSLGIFAFVAAVYFSTLTAAGRSVQIMRNQGHAEDLAVTKLSEIMLGGGQAEAGGPESFEAEYPDRADWTWEIQVEPGDVETLVTGVEIPPMMQVKIVISNPDSGTSYELVYTQPDSESEESDEDDLDDMPAGGGGR